MTWLFCQTCFSQNTDVHVVTELSPPYQIIINNEVAGSSTDKVRALLTQGQISSTFSMYPWARAYEMAVNSPNTLIYSIAKTKERKHLFHWLAPVTYYKLGLVAKSDRADLLQVSLNNLANYLVAVQRADIAHNWMLKQGFEENKHFIVSPNIESSWQLLLKEKVDFIIESPELMLNMLKSFNLAENTTQYVLPIPELELVGYLAANKHLDNTILRKLKDATNASSK
ncbi:transporter substrate-binding domain-containing protein [Paraglaciecola aquimarina]|uniref:Transporter substrate-binding domain-containing protein n=1 Tax=Paraglaciecola algarum TaxID=3050085 RepID=A0ABS9D9J3_9ALTE|nr:transporter substrate-binding domain-containing protein [Paraglaciecola sp. G1-23]MCF2949636.1 transporter substrate-binding domain-containing protein [Paraglaciecola sp. G1-23]